MSRRIRGHLRSHVIAYLALFFALSGTAVALDGTNTVFDDDIVAGAVRNSEVANNSLLSEDIKNDANPAGGLAAEDLRADSVGASEIQTGGVGADEVQSASIGADEVVDFGLSNEDVGAMYAEVNATGFLANSSGGISATHVGTVDTGTYNVDFGRDISLCAAVATIGSDTTATSFGEINVADVAGNVEAVRVDTNSSNGTPDDQPFRLIVLC